VTPRERLTLQVEAPMTAGPEPATLAWRLVVARAHCIGRSGRQVFDQPDEIFLRIGLQLHSPPIFLGDDILPPDLGNAARYQ